jgi:hypothetical protein
MVLDCILETVRWNIWESLNLFFEYDLSIVDVPVQPVASEGIHIICPQAAVRLCIRSVI